MSHKIEFRTPFHYAYIVDHDTDGALVVLKSPKGRGTADLVVEAAGVEPVERKEGQHNVVVVVPREAFFAGFGAAVEKLRGTGPSATAVGPGCLQEWDFADGEEDGEKDFGDDDEADDLSDGDEPSDYEALDADEGYGNDATA